MPGMPLLAIANLTCSHAGQPAVRGLGLSLQPGELGCLLGPSGCGKTTLLRTIAGFHAPDAGTLSLRGKDARALPPEKRGLGFVFQDLALFPHLTVADNVAFGLHELAPIYLYPGRLQPATLIDIVVNRARWDKLGPDGRATLDAACRATAVFADGANREANATALRAIAAADVAVSPPSVGTVTALRDAWAAVRDRQAAESEAFAAVVAAYPPAVD